MGLKYRSEIDGLRALAVIPVVFFHAGLDLFSGGFRRGYFLCYQWLFDNNNYFKGIRE